MGSVRKSEVIEVLHKLLGVSIEELETWSNKQLIEGIREAHRQNT